MTNKNFLKIRKVNEERYFKHYNELFRFIVEKTMNVNDERFYELAAKYNSILHEILMPMSCKEASRYIVVGDFICLLTEGCFVRTSGDYRYNLLSVQKRDNLCHNDKRTLFNYQIY